MYLGNFDNCDFFTRVKEHYGTEYMGKARKGWPHTGMAQRLTQVGLGKPDSHQFAGPRAEAVRGGLETTAHPHVLGKCLQ